MASPQISRTVSRASPKLGNGFIRDKPCQVEDRPSGENDHIGYGFSAVFESDTSSGDLGNSGTVLDFDTSVGDELAGAGIWRDDHENPAYTTLATAYLCNIHPRYSLHRSA